MTKYRNGAAYPAVDFTPLSRHEPGRAGLLFSGGKDSRAMLEIFRPYLDRIVVYHNDTSDLWPETRDFVAKVAESIPHFRRIETNAPAWIDGNAIPSPLPPVFLSRIAMELQGNPRLPVVSSLECCNANQWLPIGQRFVADGMTLCIHGQRDCDWGAAGPFAWPLGDIEEWAPLGSWTDDHVLGFLESRGIERARFLTDNGRAPPGPDCATCPAAYLDVGRVAYLRQHHPALATRYSEHLQGHLSYLGPVCHSLMLEHQEDVKWGTTTGETDGR